MVLTCGKSGVNICRARVAETGELEETPILLEVPPGTMHYISLYISLYNISVYIYIYSARGANRHYSLYHTILNSTIYTTLLGYTKFCHRCLVLTKIRVLLGTDINFSMEVDKELEWELRPKDRVLVEGQGAKIKCVAR